MKMEDFWILVIRSLAIYFGCLTIFNQAIMGVVGSFILGYLDEIGVLVAYILLTIGVVWAIIVKAPAIVKGLKLNSGLSTSTFTTISTTKSAYQIAFTIMGCWLVIQTILQFISESLSALQNNALNMDPVESKIKLIFFLGVKILIGILIVLNAARFAKWADNNTEI